MMGEEASVVRVIRGGLEAVEPVAVELVPAETRTHVVASLSLSPEPGDVEGNLLMAGRVITEAKLAHPALEWVVLPELFTSAYSGLVHVHQYAELAIEGESAQFFSALARELGVHIAYGFPEQLPIGGVSDSVNLVGPIGGGPTGGGPEEEGSAVRTVVRRPRPGQRRVPGERQPDRGLPRCL
ncbi:MAG: nitrilase-related carbon-nitrogen hydrolase, partial [Rubrobacteraceae bacterium]